MISRNGARRTALLSAVLMLGAPSLTAAPAKAPGAKTPSSDPKDLGSVVNPAKKIPVAYDVDVVVAGGGIAGTMAALAAARHGASTLVIDRFGRLGGNIGPGFWGAGSLCFALIDGKYPDDEELLNKMGLGGIPQEFHRRVIFSRPGADKMPEGVRKELERKKLNVPGWRMGYGGPDLPGYIIDSHVASHVAFQMMEEAGVKMLLSAYVADPIMQGDRVRGVFVETKSGRLAVKAKIVIDATGEADVCMRSGAPVVRYMSPRVGLFFALGGVDSEKYNEFLKGGGRAKLKQRVREANKSGEFISPRWLDKCNVHATLFPRGDAPGIAGGRSNTGKFVDFSDAKKVSLLEKEHRKVVYDYAAFVRKHVPGMENSYLLLVSPYLNARGGRYLDSVQNVTHTELKAEQKFDDVIYIYNDRRSQKNCEVPYRMLLPKRIDGLLAAGRATHARGPNLRGRCWTLLNGQAAGIAAALCVKEGIQPRKLDVRKLQRILMKLGSPFADDARLKELGLK